MTRTILFDLDDTLFDHNHSDKAGLQAVYRDFSDFHGIEQDTFVEQSMLIFDDLWFNVLQNGWTLNHWQKTCFALLCERLKVTFLNEEHHLQMTICYRDTYQNTRKAIEGAVDLLEALAQKNIQIGIVTNHLAKEQSDKLSVCNLDTVVDFVVCAEQFEHPKPDKAIFRQAIRLANTSAENIIFIGDSWTSDILGAKSVGMIPIWFNPHQYPLPSNTNVKQLSSLTPTDDVIEFLLNL